ncbi:response regulator [Idiomarina sp.]|uniref:response regulator n=1 Tax=Idiomarina sp. TaxID=1874361 RepID=UPI0025BFC6A2|nr:response regulator [Idiomarina sp.]NQZ03782.1 DUF3369 domain-containing protein [Idiomarina sp.]
MSNQFMFADEPQQAQPALLKDKWKVLIVDDEPEVHAVTKLALSDFEFLGRGLEFYSAFSGEEARQLVDQHPDAAILLLDVVMESDDAGLKVARYIREDADNHYTRIILRTGQPGQAPERTVIVNYDINDYKSKTELTAQKLFTAVMSSLRSYRDIMSVDQSRQGLEKIIEASANLYTLQPMQQFVDGIVQQLSWVIGGARQTLYATATDDGRAYRVVAANGEDSQVAMGQTLRSVLPAPALAELDSVIQNNSHHYGGDFVLMYCRSHCRPQGSVLFIGGMSRALTDDDHHVLKLFAENVQKAQDNVVCIEDTDVLMAGIADQLVHLQASHFASEDVAGSEAIAYRLGKALFDESIAIDVSCAITLYARAKPLLACIEPNAAAHETSCQQRIATSLRGLKNGQQQATQFAYTALMERLERWDGLGLPEGKKGNSIAESTQVILVSEQIADWRTQGLAESDMITRLQDERGRYYSPDFLDKVIKHIGVAVAS